MGRQLAQQQGGQGRPLGQALAALLPVQLLAIAQQHEGGQAPAVEGVHHDGVAVRVGGVSCWAPGPVTGSSTSSMAAWVGSNGRIVAGDIGRRRRLPAETAGTGRVEAGPQLAKPTGGP